LEYEFLGVRKTFKEWLKVELDNLKPKSDFRELNEVIREIRDLLQKLISDEICLYRAEGKLRDLIVKTTGYLTGWEEIHPTVEAYSEIAETLENIFKWRIGVEEELRVVWAQESIRHELVDDLFEEAYSQWIMVNEERAREEAKNILYWLYHTLKMVESEVFRSSVNYNSKIVDKILKLVEYEIECLKHQPHLHVDPMDELDYKACERCPLHDYPHCDLGKIRLKLRDYFDKHEDERKKLPLQIELLIYPEKLDDLLRVKKLRG